MLLELTTEGDEPSSPDLGGEVPEGSGSPKNRFSGQGSQSWGIRSGANKMGGEKIGLPLDLVMVTPTASGRAVKSTGPDRNPGGLLGPRAQRCQSGLSKRAFERQVGAKKAAKIERKEGTRTVGRNKKKITCGKRVGNRGGTVK